MSSEIDILEPYEKLVGITIHKKKFMVPENNSILRCLQYLDSEAISNRDLCWNGECLNCRVEVKQNGLNKTVIACRTYIQEDLEIVKLGDEIYLDSKL